MSELSSIFKTRLERIVPRAESMMRFSRNQIIGGLLLLVVIWAVILFRMIFSRP
jgi:hypothetical protein